jgi:virulence factor Mce-like protein
MSGRALPNPLRRGGDAHNAVPFGRTAIALLVVGTVIYLAFILYKMDFTVVSSRYEITAEFVDAGGLAPGDRNPVTINGVRMGKLTGVRQQDGRTLATLSMTSESKGHIHRDATIELVPRSGLQDVTIDIDAGTPSSPALGDGARIDAAHTQTYVGVDRVTQTLDADTRAYVQIALQELSGALHGRSGQLKAGLDALGPTVSDAQRVTRVLADRRTLLAKLVTETDKVFSTLGRRGDQLRDAIHYGQQTVAATAGREQELAASVRGLPGTLTEVRSALRGVQQLAQPLNPALEQLRPTAKALPGGLRALRRFVPVGDRLVDELRPLLAVAPQPVARLRSALEQLGGASRALTPGTAKLEPALHSLSANIASGGAAEMLSRVSGVLSTDDDVGPVARGSIVAEEKPYPENFGLPVGTTPAGRKKLGVDIDSALNLTCLLVNKLACDLRSLIPGTPSFDPPRSQEAVK